MSSPGGPPSPAYALFAWKTVLLYTALAALPSWAAKKPDLKAVLQESVEALEKGRTATVASETLGRRRDLAEFYRRRGFKPAWIEYGRPGPSALRMLDAARKSGLEGLDPEDYHAAAADSLIRGFTRRTFWRLRMDPVPAAELDILLSDAFLELSHDLFSGGARTEASTYRWHATQSEADLPAYLEKALAENDVRASLHRLAPPETEYGVMKYWLARYRRLQASGGWEPVAEGPALDSASRGPRVASLCRRLAAEGLARGCGDEFSPELADAVRRFQSTHGLRPDGVVDKATLAQLNVTVLARIGQIKINLEGWRRMPRVLGDRHVRVNIPDFSLRAFAGDREELAMKVVAGRKQDSTPVFSDSIVGIALNPSWNVPDDIARAELLPELKRDPEYLEKHGMELLESWRDDARVLRADSIAWEDMDSAGFKFRVREKPGGEGALGDVKFILTNPFNIYLHDTPQKGGFAHARRAFSHGCVRVEKPLDLALWVLAGDPLWDRKRLETEIATGEPMIIPLRDRGVPIHILYWTAFTDKEEGLQFRPDVYGWDRRMERDLKQGEPQR
jgi:murein L,D-transpeptidase YcbB/YkuD